MADSRLRQLRPDRRRLALLRRGRRRRGSTEHIVEVDRATLDDLAPGATPEELVRESFVYLLEREPRESIMRAFELPIIARFFGDYPDEISRRLRGS